MNILYKKYIEQQLHKNEVSNMNTSISREIICVNQSFIIIFWQNKIMFPLSCKAILYAVLIFL